MLWGTIRAGFTYSRVPKHSLAVYPFRISIVEHVPLNMGARRNFFQGGASSGFFRGGSK